MAGRVLGKHFTDVVGLLLAHSDADPRFIAAHRAALDAIEPESERSWEQFAAEVSQVASTVRKPKLVELGAQIVAASKAEFERWGFDTAEKILADWDAPFGASIIDAPEEQSVHTLKYTPGHAFLRASAVLPAGLIEGYIRGVVAMFGAELTELACHEVAIDGQPCHLFELRYGSLGPRARNERPDAPG